MIDPANLPRIKKLIIELNSIAEVRKGMLDQLWSVENHTEQLRIELMKLLNHKELYNHEKAATN
jgi:hypothetical protein